ncbi:L-serine ammonia-lyase, iron-sulfur-dependent, subunit alpha [Neobacillus sp. C211]|jgi:iron-sulfur-dependent L-serine dehydratase alpha subunit|uniref:L-serine dehydratase n=1 Tax=Priestia megaterium TaxID=1404 RepID=A0A6H1P6B6_PRIMG|nr:MULTISPECIES: L-serine ammonia-lyase, iron-sulfur-dependent, subunit alpha [Bacillaceae]MBT2698406.1 L-serine ammonia-lyase, iron-sulfur-dependent, subunit alpha [Bacillus sp. ISL-40]MBT2722103.1 L-serine ammonia-lyase, iron-sulfur-dependent, subunit alpha [Bacillus sp. ISL-46]MBT2740609.1 L-serine ammonia-lyase, iron-sulfur-dependent, subunit alpha [Bacillus sp. ISL-77]PGY07951.1 L-serine ammonia-lyase, iron-sulfur-dependent, subunit alpha [Bacillus sp. AFS031507]QIZ09109.1 L-serine ammoni
MKIQSMKELIEACEREQKTIGEIMLMMETEKSGRDQETIISMMEERLIKMKEAVDSGIKDASTAPSGISGGDAVKMYDYVHQGKSLSGSYVSNAMSFSLATSESNARMGVIVATPTAGAAGILPGVLFSLHKNDGTPYKDLVMGLFTASMLGFVIANRSFISGAAGGCQAEVGSATAMAAGTIVELKGGTPQQAVNATAIAMKSLLGLVCDPVAGLVEVPCIKRNVIGTSIAFSAADMSLAGIESRIPCDEVIEAMYRVGKDMPRTLRETALGGLATTETGKQVKERLFCRKS